MLNQFNQPLWGDEGFSAILSMHTLPDIIHIIINDTSPPLWNICEWIVFNTLGTNEVYIRALAFSFFLVAVFFAYKIGSFLWGRNTGIIAAVLTALNPFFFTYAFEGRMYSIMSAGVAGSMYFFLRMMYSEKKVEAKHILGYVVMTLWAIYSHHFAMFAVATQGLWFIYLLLTKKKTAGGIFLGFAGVGIGYIPWVWPLYHQFSMVAGGFWLGKPKLADLVALIFQYLAYGVSHLLAFPALVVTSAILFLRRWGKNKEESLFLLSWFLLPILATFVISQFFSPIFYSRYLLYTIPAAMILVASKRRAFSNIPIFVVIILFAIIDFHYFTHPTKPRFDLVVDYVRRTQQEGDYLINWNTTPHFLWESKYYGIPAPLYLQNKNALPYFVGTALMMPGDIIYETPQKVERIGVITSGPIDEIKLPGYTESRSKTFGQVKFAWFTSTHEQ